MAGPGYGEAGGQEPAENQTPTSQTAEETVNGIEVLLQKKRLNEGNREVLSRILTKHKDNLKK